MRIISASALVLLLSGCFHPGPGAGYGPMMNGTYGYGYGGYIMWILLLILAAVVIWALFFRGKAGNFPGSREESALEVLKRRYANGDITKEEYDRMKRDIE